MIHKKDGKKMDTYFDFEVAISQVRSKRTQKYLQEVLSTYYNHEYRSCIVMLYATTFADALEKIKTMAEVYENEKAVKFLEKYEANRASHKAYSSLERDVKEFIFQSGFINDVEEKQWEHLKDYRDYCAHPVVEKDYELISPNGEQVRMHIRNMFEAIFFKDAILADSKVFDEFLKKVENFYDRNELDGLEEYVKSRYIKRLDLKTKGRFVKNLWKFAFYINDDECEKYRRVAYRTLIWIIESDRSGLLQIIEKDIDFFNGKIDYQNIDLQKGTKDFHFYENKTTALIFFLYKVPEVYKLLSLDNQTEIREAAMKNINLLLVSSFLFESRKKHVEQMILSLCTLNYCLNPILCKQVCRAANEDFDKSYNDMLIFYFYRCQNSSSWSPDWDYINWTYREIIKDTLKYFNQKQLESFVEQLTSFHVQATCFMGMANQIVAIAKDKGYDIMFDSYDINLLEYIEEENP